MKGKRKEEGLGRVRDGNREKVRATVLAKAIGMVLLVLFAGLTVLFIAGYMDLFGSGEDWTLEDGVVIVRGDVVWEGLTGVLETPVEVRDGGSLIVKDSDIDIRVEDIYFGQRDWFDVEEGGMLSVQDSTIEVVVDPDLENAVYIYQSDNVDEGRYVPRTYISRTVDLRRAVNPELVFDINPRGCEGDLIVGVTASPVEEMQVQGTVHVAPAPTGDWVHIRVPLEEHAGSIVRLAVFTRNASLDKVFLKDVRVVHDDGADLPGDRFEGPFRYGWRSSDVSTLFYDLGGRGWPELIQCFGTLKIDNSSVLCQPAPRGSRAFWSSNLGKFVLTSPFRPGNLDMRHQGGDIVAPGGEVTIGDSHLDNVSLIASRCEVSVDSTIFIGDRELVTLFECEGGIMNTRFNASYGIYCDLYKESFGSFQEPWLWGLSVWGNSGRNPFEIVDCTFEGLYMGVDLADTSVVLSGCHFKDIMWMGIWDHETDGIGSWADINATCQFDGTTECRYIRTHRGRLTYTAVHVTSNDWQDQAYLRISDTDGGWLPDIQLASEFTGGAHLYMPTFVVNGSGESININWIEVKVNSYGAGDAIEVIDTQTRNHTIVLLGEEEPNGGSDDLSIDPWWGLLHVEELKPDDPDVLNISVSVDHDYLVSAIGPSRASNLTIEVYLDGGLHRSIDVASECAIGWYYAATDILLPMTPGCHSIKLVLTGIKHGEVAVQPLKEVPFQIMRVSNSTTDDEVARIPSANVTYLYIDPGVDVEINDLSHVPYYSWWGEEFKVASLRVHIPEDACVTISDLTIPDGTLLGITAIGPGSLNVVGIDAPCVSLNVKKTRVKVNEVTTHEFVLSSDEADIEVSNLSMVEREGEMPWSILTQWKLRGSNASIFDSRIELQDDDEPQMTFWRSNVTLSNTIIHGEEDQAFIIEARDGSSVSFDDGTVENVNLTFSIEERTGSVVDIVGSEFVGTGANLVLGYFEEPIDRRPSGLPVFNLEGNRFIGLEGGVVVNRTLHGTMGENSLEDGASVKVWHCLTVEFKTDVIEAFVSYEIRPTSDADLVVEWIYREWNDRKLIALVSIPDPESYEEPIEVPVVVHRDGHVWWFTVLTLDVTNVTVPISTWEDDGLLIVNLLRRMEEGSWWSD